MTKLPSIADSKPISPRSIKGIINAITKTTTTTSTSTKTTTVTITQSGAIPIPKRKGGKNNHADMSYLGSSPEGLEDLRAPPSLGLGKDNFGWVVEEYDN